jgi:hypothetical protein
MGVSVRLSERKTRGQSRRYASQILRSADIPVRFFGKIKPKADRHVRAPNHGFDGSLKNPSGALPVLFAASGVKRPDALELEFFWGSSVL